LGPLEVSIHGAPPPRLRYHTTGWVLALLALRGGAPVDRDWLAALLWPDRMRTQALRNCLAELRRALGPECHRLRSLTPRTLSLDLSGAWVDVRAFDAVIAAGDVTALEEAVALHRGPLLEGCAEEWVLAERERREQEYLGALERLAAYALGQGNAAAAEGYLRRAVAADPLRESAQRALMQALATGGNSAAATQVYRDLRLHLHRELNAEPDPETVALFQQLRSQAREKASGHTARRAPDRNAGRTRNPGAAARLDGEPADHSPNLPAGTVTFLLTDIEGSSRLWEQHTEAMRIALARHELLVSAAIRQHGGNVIVSQGEGDSFFAVFAHPTDAVAAASALQQSLQSEPWPEEVVLRVRAALHTGEAELRSGNYFGVAVNRCARLRAIGHGGQILLSQTTAALACDALPEGVTLRDLGTHRLKDLQRPEPIFQLMHPELPAEFPPLGSLEAFAHNLPLQLTRFIGREEQMAQVKHLLQSARLLTLTGAGGCGKTRLALQVAADLLVGAGPRACPLPDGAWVVELASLSDPALVPQTVAAALAVREEPGRPVPATLLNSLRSRSLLLVLDNCEHLLSACANLAEDVLRSCPNVKILATSREGLGVPGERTYRVPPLSAADPRQLPGLEELRELEAVSLFADRARFSQPDFAVTPANALAVAQVCHRLDGIPLAIELAAARVKALPVEKLAERLDDRFRLLTGGSRTALPRQQTLRALIDWSYDLLSERERALLRCLSVFAGGWTLEAAEAVCAEGVEEWEVLDLLTSLVEKSLVLYDERDGEARYRLLETIRQYAWDRLVEAGGAAAVRGRHLEWYRGLAEQAMHPLYRAATQGEWVGRLERELDNLRAALDWSTEAGASPEGAQEAEAGLRLAGWLRRFWLHRGYLAEMRERLARLLATPAAAAHTPARANALVCAGWLAFFQVDYETARSVLAESLIIRRELNDPWGTALSLAFLANVTLNQGDYRAARSQCEEALGLWRETGIGSGEMAYSLTTLGEIAYAQGELDASRALLEESRPHWGDDRWGTGLCLHRLGVVRQAQGDTETPCALFRESLALFQAVGEKRGIAGCLEGIAGAAMASCCTAGREDSLRDAARLFGAAAALRDTVGTPLPPYDRAAYNDHLAALRAGLGEEGFAAAWAEGWATSLEDAIRFALEEVGNG
jgi:predicted ATPase/class 3 adenylate cyclase